MSKPKSSNSFALTGRSSTTGLYNKGKSISKNSGISVREDRNGSNNNYSSKIQSFMTEHNIRRLEKYKN